MNYRLEWRLLFSLAVGVGLFLYSYAVKDFLVRKDFSCSGCNIIFVGFDALQANRVTHLGYGRDTTPTLDRLAAEGVSFSKNYAVSSWTVPSFMSYLTSLYPAEHKLTNKFTIFSKEEKIIANLNDLSPNVLTLAQAFKSAGYITGGFTGDAGVNSVFGYNKGFDVYTDEQPFGSMSRSAAHAMEWLKANSGKKFFMFFHGYDAHGQFSELEPNYRSRYATEDPTIYHIGPERQRFLREEGLQKGQLDLSAGEVKAWNDWYDGKIRDTDERLNSFLTALEKDGFLKNTVVVVAADHGTELYEHGRFDHGFSLYNELIHVPLIIKWPDRKIGRLVTAQVSSIDLVPTIFDIVGLPKNDGWKNQIRGESLLPIIEGRDSTNRAVFSETDYRNYAHKRSYIDRDGWKIIISLESGDTELYNLTVDPKEVNDLKNAEPQRVYEMTQILYAHMKKEGEDPFASWPIGCLPVYNDQCSDTK